MSMKSFATTSVAVLVLASALPEVGRCSAASSETAEGALTIVPESNADKVAHFACGELARYLGMISGEAPEVSDAPGTRTIFLGRLPDSITAGERQTMQRRVAELKEDGFILKSYPDSLVIMGNGSRGLLYGVYAYLEKLGVRWYFAGADNEVVPHGEVRLSGFDTEESPSFARRAMVIVDYGLAVHEWIDFAAKMRLNAFFLHSAAPIWTGEAGYGYSREAVMPFIEERGMFFELGGHWLHMLLPRDLFGEHPEYFRMAGGERTNRHNLCPSSEEGMAILKSAVAKIVSGDSKVDVYHIWSSDAIGWCECEGNRCKGFTPSEQAMFVNNAVAETVLGLKPQADVAYLAYAGTINNPPQKVKPAPGTQLLYAARDRCYAHGFGNDTCPTNVHWKNRLNAYLKVYPVEEAAIFEYYIDQVVFGKEGPPLPDTIKEDYTFYHGLGVKEVIPLLVTLEPLQTVLVNAFLYPKVAWNLDVDLGAELRDMCEGYFESSGMFDYFKTRERMFKRRYCTYIEATPKDFEELFGSGKLEDWLAYKQIVAAERASKSDIGKKRIRKELDALRKLILPNYAGVVNQ